MGGPREQPAGGPPRAAGGRRAVGVWAGPDNCRPAPPIRYVRGPPLVVRSSVQGTRASRGPRRMRAQWGPLWGRPRALGANELACLSIAGPQMALEAGAGAGGELQVEHGERLNLRHPPPPAPSFGRPPSLRHSRLSQWPICSQLGDANGLVDCGPHRAANQRAALPSPPRPKVATAASNKSLTSEIEITTPGLAWPGPAPSGMPQSEGSRQMRTQIPVLGP